MSDTGRKDFSDKVGEKVTPDSQKSTTDKISESVTGATDKVSRDVQPDSSKSTTQELSDKTSCEKHDGESTTDKIKHGLGLGGDKH
ncbi:hypothetical protein K461DRAFT_311600 [Myriangium duriaei CBS 260.36]|uniref:Chaperone/heat shock protein Hsp12 n=1 Tax=Myriangium duriaei CBS 260.36 TaxID=1168546 RepID=A0A9P4J4L6_9PEZI|nr:hypothetical protein K461DRAFT_311600 [Myriangium duriaei CBS 260.36]